MENHLENNFFAFENFGHSLVSTAYRLQLKSSQDIREAYKLARATELTMVARGAGRSYNDAALNGGGIVLDLSAMNRVLSWNKATGQIVCEPGVTLEQLWQHILSDGWWPPVVSGTMKTTLGGCLAANIHGKNNYQMGPIGEHVLEFTVLLPSGASLVCSPKRNSDLFYGMISGLGMLGIFTSMTLQMKRIYSGRLEVKAWPTPNLRDHLESLLENAPEYDYVVGWMDTTVRGRSLGRGQIHAARYLAPGEDPDSGRYLQIKNQILPARLFGIMPKSILHYFMRPFVNNLGWSVINSMKYLSSLRRHTFFQSHAAFHFLLDYIPDWERSYGRHGLIQYQSFLPKETAEPAWREMLQLSHRSGVPAFLGVTKRHRPDKFLLTHAVDGFSLALDFKVTRGNKAKLALLLETFDQIVLQAGGRFYFAKNSETTQASTRDFLGPQILTKFHRLKKRCDPEELLESDLYRRVFK
jgi:FAD/FMN-containing dehydrogenase